MILENIYPAKFITRHNRFVGEALLDNKKILFHIADTGRLTNLLTLGNDILIQKLNTKTKYKFRLIASKSLLDQWALTNSFLHSKLIEEYLNKSNIKYKKEVTIGESRIDFLVENKFVEIKGCSLIEKEGERFIAKFPDAPTKRGTKHIETLIKLLKSNQKAEIWFLLSHNVNLFQANFQIDPIFSKNFYKFLELGGKVKFLLAKLNYDCSTLQLDLKEHKVKIL